MATDSNQMAATSNQTHVSMEQIISDNILYMFQVVVYVTLIGLVSTFGILANIINIFVFVKQGLMSDSSNVSLCGLAVADLCCLVSLLWSSVLWSLVVSEPNGLNWDPLSVKYLTGGYPYLTVSNITCTISAYIAFERCICVVFPFKVKNLFTVKRSLIVIICIYVYFILSVVPIFLTLQLRWTHDPVANKSLLVLHATKHHEIIDMVIISYSNSIGIRTVIILVVLVCTHLIASRVRSSMNWRKSASSSAHAPSKTKASNERTEFDDGGDIKYNDTGKQPKITIEAKTQMPSKVSSKETTLIKMITAISTIFVICCTPDIILSYTMLAVTEIRSFGQYHNAFYVLHSIKFFMESINSSVNIFVYYNMSTRYRNIFKQMMGTEGFDNADKIS